MKKRSRLLAMLLSAAMVATSIQVPVMAAEAEPAEDEVVFEEAAAEDAEAVDISQAEEEIAEAEAEAEDAETVAEDVEEAPADAMIGDPATDTYVVVRSFDELSAALEAAQTGIETVIVAQEFSDPLENDTGFAVSGNKALKVGAGKNIVLKLADDIDFDVKALEKAYEDGDYAKFPVASITVESGATLKLDGLVDDDNYYIRYNLINEGTLIVGDDNSGIGVVPYYGSAVINKGEAKLEYGSFSSACAAGVVINEKDATMVTDDITVNGCYQASKLEDVTSDNYAFINRGTLLVEDSGIFGNIGDNVTFSDGKVDKQAYMYGLYNEKDAVLTVRGESKIDRLLNMGTATIGRENRVDDGIGYDTNINYLYNVEGGVLLQHNGSIDNLYLNQKASEYATVGSGEFTQVGGYVYNLKYGDKLPVLRSGAVGIKFDYDEWREIYGGSIRKTALVTYKDEKQGRVRADAPTSYKYMGHILGEADTGEVIERTFGRAYDKDKDADYNYFRYSADGIDADDYDDKGELKDSCKFLVASYIRNGVPYITNKNGESTYMYEVDKVNYNDASELNAKPIKTVADFKAAAASTEEGWYYLVPEKEGDNAGTFVLNEAVTVTSPGFGIVPSYTYKDKDDEGKDIDVYSLSSFIIKDAGSIKVAADGVLNLNRSNNGYSGMSIRAVGNSSAAIVNEGTANIYYISADTYTDEKGNEVVPKTLVDNKGTLELTSVSAYKDGDVLIKNQADGKATVGSVRNDYAKASSIENAGSFFLTGYTSTHTGYIDNEGKATENLITIKNTGTMEISGGVRTGVTGGTAVENGGELLVSGTVEGGAEKTTAIKCTAGGKLVQSSGTIRAYQGEKKDLKDCYAIVYADTEPILIGGDVYGSRSTLYDYIEEYDNEGNVVQDSDKEDKLIDAVYGSAVVTGTSAPYKTGSFKNSENDTARESLNAGYISGGVIPYNSEVNVHGAYTSGDLMPSRHDYLLMEVGESVAAEDMNRLGESSAFGLRLYGNTFGVKDRDLFEFVITGDAVKIDKATASEYDKDAYGESENLKDRKLEVISAVKPGMSTVKAKCKIADSEDYIVIEVVRAGDREKIVASSYDAKLATPQIEVNAYQKNAYISVDWRLKNYDNVTGKYDMANNFYPTQLKITGSTLEGEEDYSTYFSTGAFERDGLTKTYRAPITINPITESIVGDDGIARMVEISTKLAQDEITSIDDLNVTLVVKNTVSKKTLEIPLDQKLNISVKQVKPSAKLSKGTVNGAYKNAYVEVDPKKHKTAFGHFHYYYPLGNTIDFREDDDDVCCDDDITDIEYIGKAKGGSFKLPVKVNFNDYYGEYDAELPVSVKTVFPKVQLYTKGATVVQKASDYENIKVQLTAKDVSMLRAISSVEVVGPSSFEVAGYDGIDHVHKGKKLVDVYGFRLKPRADLAKGESVNLRVNYRNLKRNGGKKNYTMLKFSVKPADYNKFKLIPSSSTLYVGFDDKATDSGSSSATPKNNTKTNEYAWVSWDVNPADVVLTDTYFTVKSSDGKLVVADEAGDKAYNGVASIDNDVAVYGGPSLTASDKTADLTINWYKSDGTAIGKPVTVKVPICSAEGTVTDLKPVNIAFDKQILGTWDNPLIIGGDNFFGGYFIYGEIPVKLTNGMALESIKYHGYQELFRKIFVANGKLYVVMSPAALEAGKIAPGSTYNLEAVFKSPNGEEVIKPLVVNISQVKKVRAAGSADPDEPISALTSYARTRVFIDTVSPAVGLTIESIELDAKSAAMFDVSNTTYVDYSEVDNDGSRRNHRYVLLTWKDNQAPTGVKGGSTKVTMTVKYTCGATAKITVPVTVLNPGPAKAKKAKKAKVK